MIGLIRNLVRGHPPRYNNPTGGFDNEPGKAGLNPISWFNAKNQTKHLRSMILDFDGLRTIVDDDYANEGEREGWLEYDGIWTNPANEQFLVYRLL